MCIQLGLLEVGWPQSRLPKALSVEPPPRRSITISHGQGSGRLCLEELYHGRVPIDVSRRPSSIDGMASNAHDPAQQRSALSALPGLRNPLPVERCGGKPTIINGVQRRHREGASR